MRRTLLSGLTLCALAGPAATAQAGTPFTLGEGRAPHVAIGAGNAAHVVWHDETSKVFHCRLPRGATACDPLTTLDAGVDAAATYALVAPDGAVHLLMPHYVSDKTYRWTSTDGGRTFGPRATIYGFGGGTDSTEPVLGPQPGQVTFAASNPSNTTWSAALDGSEEMVTARATLTGTGGYDFQVAPTGDGGLVAVGNDLQTAGFHRLAPGGDPSDAAAWSAATPLPGQDDTTRVAGGPGGTFMLSTVGPTDAHMNLRRWNGSGFAAPVEVDEYGYINDVHAGPSGAVAAIWRVNNPNGNLLRLALSKDGGATYPTSTIAVEDAIMRSMDVALAPDDAGLAVFEGAGGSNGARQLIRAADLTPVEAVSPNPPSVLRKTAKAPGATLRLEVPGNCLEANSSFSAFFSVKKKRGTAGRRYRGVSRVDFLLGAARVKKDRTKPFDVTISTDDLVAKKKYTVRARATVKLRGGKTVKRTVSATVQMC